MLVKKDPASPMAEDSKAGTPAQTADLLSRIAARDGISLPQARAKLRRLGGGARLVWLHLVLKPLYPETEIVALICRRLRFFPLSSFCVARRCGKQISPGWRTFDRASIGAPCDFMKKIKASVAIRRKFFRCDSRALGGAFVP